MHQVEEAGAGARGAAVGRPDVLQLHARHLRRQRVLRWHHAPEHHALQLRERPCAQDPTLQQTAISDCKTSFSW